MVVPFWTPITPLTGSLLHAGPQPAMTGNATTRALETLKRLFESDAIAEPYGEAISIRDHMLQCAELTQARALAPHLVAAALLHDIGWALAKPHETVAAAWLASLFGPAVTAPIRWHVAAKRYLVGRDEAYLACLSDASVQTLARQGGPMPLAERASFEALACHDDALALRRVDDAGKELRPPRSRFDDYRDLLVTLAIRDSHDGRDRPRA